jgi:hypothetical protein
MKRKYSRLSRRVVMGNLEVEMGVTNTFVDIPRSYYELCVSAAQRALHKELVKFYSSAAGQQYLRNYTQGRITNNGRA